MLRPLGVTPSGIDLGAQLPQGFGRDVIGGAVGAIDHDLEPVEPQMLGEGRLGELDVAAARVVDPPGAADHAPAWRASGSFSSRFSIACSSSSLSL